MGSDAPPIFDLEERVLDEVPLEEETLVVIPRRLAVLAGRNLSLRALDLGLLKDGFAVVAFVGDQVLGIQFFDESATREAAAPRTTHGYPQVARRSAATIRRSDPESPGN